MPPEAVGWATADVAEDPLDEHVADADAVVHLAWLFQPTHRPQVTWNANVPRLKSRAHPAGVHLPGVLRDRAAAPLRRPVRSGVDRAAESPPGRALAEGSALPGAALRRRGRGVPPRRRKDVSGAFNLAADPVVDPQVAGELLDARFLEGRLASVRRGIGLTWAAHLVPAAPELFDVVMQLPLMGPTRARTELGWTPAATSREALAELLRGLQRGADGETAPLSEETGGRMRSHEVSTGVGTRP